MKTFGTLLITGFLLVMLCSSCKTTQLLREDFSADVIGNQPLKNIPGDPPGDSVRYNAPVIGSRLRIRESSNPGRKVLEFSEAPITSATASNQWLFFDGSVANYTQPIWFSWSGQQRGSQSDLLIDITGTKALFVCRLIIRANGQLELITKLADETADVLGRLDPAQTHTVIIALQPAAKTYNITVFGMLGGASVVRKNVSVVGEASSNPMLSNVGKPSIGFRYKQDNNNPNAVYRFESVNILKKQP